MMLESAPSLVRLLEAVVLLLLLPPVLVHGSPLARCASTLSLGPPLELNPGTVVRNANGVQTLPSVSTLSASSAVAVWESNVQSGNFQIYGSLFAANSTALVLGETGFLVNRNSTLNRLNPVVQAVGGAGRFAVLYQATVALAPQSPPQTRLQTVQRMYIQFFDVGARRIVDEIDAHYTDLDTATVGMDVLGVLAASPTRLFAAWMSFRANAQGSVAGTGDVLVRSFELTTNGTLVTSAPRRANTFNTTGYAQASAVGMASVVAGDRLLVVWPSAAYACTVGATYLALQWFATADLRPLGMEARLNWNATGTVTNPTAQHLGGGKVLVTWTWSPSVTSQVTVLKSQVLDAALLSRQAGEIYSGEVAATSPGDGVSVGLGLGASASPSGFASFWNAFNTSTGDGYNIYGGVYSLAGEIQQPAFAFPLATANVTSSTLPAVDTLGDGRIVVAWVDDNQQVRARLVACAPGCEYSEWSAWSPCSNTCGTGVSTRSRRLLQQQPDSICNEPLVESQECTGTACIDCSNCINGVCYLLGVNGSRSLTQPEAQAACSTVPGCSSAASCLAYLEDFAQRYFLVYKFTGAARFPAWIRGYGSHVSTAENGVCMILGTSGEIVIPANGCSARKAALCQIPQPSFCPPTP